MGASIGSFLLGTRRGDELRRWYRESFGGVETEHGALRFGDVVLAIDERPDVLLTNAEPGRLAVGFLVPDLDGRWRGHATVADPDGNVVHLMRDVSRRTRPG